jgi:hypothetical protein
MIARFLCQKIEVFENKYDYDASYLRELLKLSGSAFWRFTLIAVAAHFRKNVPLAAWYAARIIASRGENCGPCTQLVIDMARAARVEDSVLQAILQDDLSAMGDDAALAYRYARAAVAHRPDIGLLCDEVRVRWGSPALASLAFAATTSRLFPMLKYALGHGQRCERITVGGRTIAPANLNTP